MDNVEVFFLSSNLSCSLPALPEGREGHTMDSNLICGGTYPSSTTCLTFSSGKWITSHTLLEGRYGHSSMMTNEGLVLLGGQDSLYSSEIVHLPGEQGEAAFDMHHNTE